MLVPARAFQIDASLETHFDSLLTSGRKDTGILIGAVGSHDKAAASAKLANLRVCGVASSIQILPSGFYCRIIVLERQVTLEFDFPRLAADVHVAGLRRQNARAECSVIKCVFLLE